MLPGCCLLLCSPFSRFPQQQKVPTFLEINNVTSHLKKIPNFAELSIIFTTQRLEGAHEVSLEGKNMPNAIACIFCIAVRAPTLAPSIPVHLCGGARSFCSADQYIVHVFASFVVLVPLLHQVTSSCLWDH